MHELGHALGIPDVSDPEVPGNTNPDQYKGNLMHWTKEDWDIELEDELKDEFKDGDSRLLGDIY